jgi:hypothetical protein
MGKKQKVDEPENYEVWISYVDDRGWVQVQEKGNDGIFGNKVRAMLLAENNSHKEGVVETIVISRRAVAAFNGEAIALKHRLKELNKKKEEKTDVVPDEVHGDRPEAGDVPAPGAQHGGQADPARAGSEGAPQG